MKEKAKQKKDRIFLFDFLRGVLLILIMIDHFFYDVYAQYGFSLKGEFFVKLYEFSIVYYGGLYRKLVRPIGLFVLFFISGILTDFSRNNLVRTIKYGVIALLIFLVTFIFSFIIDSKDVIITIGVMYVFTVCALFGYLAKRFNFNTWVLLGVGIVLSAVGLIYFFGVTDFLTGKLFFIFYNLDVGGKYSADYFPLLPFMGYFIMGIAVSRIFYKNKKELIRFPLWVKKAFSPITFIGRTSLWWYVLSQGVFIGFFELCINMGW